LWLTSNDLRLGVCWRTTGNAPKSASSRPAPAKLRWVTGFICATSGHAHCCRRAQSNRGGKNELVPGLLLKLSPLIRLLRCGLLGLLGLAGLPLLLLGNAGSATREVLLAKASAEEMLCPVEVFGR